MLFLQEGLLLFIRFSFSKIVSSGATSSTPGKRTITVNKGVFAFCPPSGGGKLRAKPHSREEPACTKGKHLFRGEFLTPMPRSPFGVCRLRHLTPSLPEGGKSNICIQKILQLIRIYKSLKTNFNNLNFYHLLK